MFSRPGAHGINFFRRFHRLTNGKEPSGSAGTARYLKCLGRCGGESLDEGLVDGGAVRPDFVDE